ncbi:PepSY-associated TM helix domain-containing protein [Alteraurantiacibacter aquimixticola]|uniref:PepSY domain-containing protein n=1 Tax=Alteraurantiacibacter aquimixticola TaxID=2489173 RepID=A0A4T3F5L9_9SPHN|nr:PepSY-associated TM helix domain-containing protein [Alteraurantiacibacter aquimixticola]TIX51684.1 PepSY domain-containing protein [Alteraurantiacibacter aquimixticola]
MTASKSAALPKKRKPLMSRIPADFVRAVLKGHSGLGLAFAAVIYIVCLSGTLSVFVDEFERWEDANAPVVESVSPEAVQSAYESAVARAGSGLEHVFITMPAGDLPRLRIQTDAEEDRIWFADTQGELVTESHGQWSTFIVALHENLHLPRTWGMFLVGLTGVALLSSLISGILAHPRIFRDAFHLRLGGSRRLQEADLHNRIGVWGLPFHVILSLSGAFLGLTTIIVGVLGMAVFEGDTAKIYALFQPSPPIDNPAAADPLDLLPMFAQLPDSGGHLTSIFMEHPTEQGGAALFNIRYDGALAAADSLAFDRSGELYYAKRAEDFTLGESILGSLGQLHFGWFGGGVIKIVYGLLGLGLTYLAAGGVNIWLARKRDQGRPAERWESIWDAFVWGQPLALTAAALSTVAAPGLAIDLAVMVWLGISLGSLAAAAALPAPTISRLGRGASGALLLLLALVHILLASGPDAVSWTIDLVLALAGAVLVASVFPFRRGRHTKHLPIGG